MSQNYGFGEPAPRPDRAVPPHHPTVTAGYHLPADGQAPPHQPTVSAGYYLPASGGPTPPHLPTVSAGDRLPPDGPVPPHHPTVTSGYRLPPSDGPVPDAPAYDDRFGPGYAYGPPPSWHEPPQGYEPPPGYGPAGPSPYGPPPAHRPRSAAPPALLVVGSVVLALLLGVGATLLYVQPWAQASSRVEGSAAPDVVTPQGGATPFTPEASTPAPDPGTELAQLAAQDRATVAAIPEGSWVPQISSKKDGLTADGIVYDDAAILSNHQGLRGRYQAVLLRSDDWATFKYPGFWVTIVPGQASGSPATANAWCDAQGFPREECYAKRIGTGSYDTTTMQR